MGHFDPLGLFVCSRTFEGFDPKVVAQTNLRFRNIPILVLIVETPVLESRNNLFHTGDTKCPGGIRSIAALPFLIGN
jgi:hypothetical protein